MKQAATRSQHRRNSLFAASVTLIALTFLFYPDEGRLPWVMWRDSTAVAVGMVVAGLICGVLWWRTPRD